MKNPITPSSQPRIVRLTPALTIAVILAAVWLGSAAFSRRALAWQTPPAVVSISAAGYGSVLTPEGIAAAFGVNFTNRAFSAAGLPLPTTLGGVSVTVNERAAGLFFVSPGQINYLLPPETVAGTARVVVRASDGTTQNGTLQVATVAPAFFTANANGAGVAAAVVMRVKVNGAQSFEPVAQLDTVTRRFKPLALDLGPPGERLFLIAFLSGLRRAPLGTVRVLFGTAEVTPDFYGPAPGLAGVDQLNVLIPRGVQGAGVINVSVTVPDGPPSKEAQIEIAGQVTASQPRITGFAPALATAGELLTLTGTGFDALRERNLVRLGAGETERGAETASPTQLTIRVPFNAESGRPFARSSTGEGLSDINLPVRTTLSGVIGAGKDNFLPGVRVTYTNLGTGFRLSTVTASDGTYQLRDLPAGGGGIIGYDTKALNNPGISLQVDKNINVLGNRDNKRPLKEAGVGDSAGSQSNFAPADNARSSVPQALTLTVGGLRFELPDNATVKYPADATQQIFYLTLLENGQAGAPLPPGIFSSAIALISPAGVSFAPGGRLTFPNRDGLAANAPARLYRLDQTETSPTLGTFLQAGTATVSADGQRVETAANAITEAGLYFAALPQATATLVGRVVDSDGRTPVRNADVSARGQQTVTDGNGGFILRDVPVGGTAGFVLEAALLRATGRLDRAERTLVSLPAGINRLTPDLVLSSPATQPNRPPSLLVTPASLALNEGAQAALSVLTSDPDPGQTVQLSVSGAPFATAQGTSAIRLTPGAGSRGNYTLVVRATDSQGASSTQNVAVVVTPAPNRPPVLSVPGPQTIAEGQPLAFVINATDPDGQPLTFSAANVPAGATFNAATRQFAWTPSFTQAGNYTVSFTVSDNGAPPLGDTKTVAISVGNVNRPPTATAQTITLAEDSTRLITLTASDPENDPLTYSIVAQPTRGTLTGTPPNLSYTPQANYNGPDSFTFRARDGSTDSNLATVTLNITPVNDLPVAAAQAVTTTEDTPRTITLSATDADGDTLTYSIVTPPANGTLTGTPPAVTYTPAANFNGAASFTFKARDAVGDSNTATVSITVTGINDKPIVNVPGPQSATTGAPLSFTVTATNVDTGQTLTFAATGLPAGASFNPATGQFTWTPGATQIGAFTVTFTVSDNGTPPLTSDPKTVTITVANTTPPVANAQTVTTPEDTARQITLTGSDSANRPLTYTVLTQPVFGTLTGAAPNLTYTPTGNYNGADSFTFRVNNGVANSNTATVTINVTPVNDPPVLTVPGAQTVAEGQPLNFVVNATDPDAGQTLTFSAANVPTGATFTAATRQFAWTPSFNQAGNYTVSFTVSDNGNPALTNTKTVAISVGNINRPPTANGQTITLAEDTPRAIVLTASDPETDALTYSLVTPPTRGTLTGTPPNVTYTPQANYNGADSFTFKTRDGSADSNTATVALTVTPVNDLPVANAQSVTTPEDTPRAITLAATDVDGDTLTYSIVTAPVNGSLAGTPPNVTYAPRANFNGTDSFTFKARDGVGDSNTATVTITVGAVNDKPIVNVPGAQNVTTGALLTFTITATDADAGQTIIFAATGLPAGASLNPTSGVFTWTPTSTQSGTFTVSFTATDNGTPPLTSDPKTVAITVAPATGAITGTVRNASNAQIIAGATIAVVGGNLTATTSATGAFTLNNVPPGARTLNVSASGFVSTQVPVNVTAGQTVTQNVSLSIALAAGQIRITLNWTKDANLHPNDLDAHLTGPTDNGCFHVFFLTDNRGSLTAPPFAMLEVDNISSTVCPVSSDCPPTETVRIAQLRTGLYRFYVRNFSAGTTTGDTSLGAARAQVQVFDGTGLRDTFVVPTGAGRFWNVFELNGQGVITRLNVLAETEPGLTCGVTPNTPPIANAQTVASNEDTPKLITLTGTDADNDPLTFTIVTQPARGTLTGTGANLMYTPSANLNGADVFTFKVNDGKVDSATATVAINVTPVCDAPVLTMPGTQTVNLKQELVINISATDADAGQTITLSAVSNPSINFAFTSNGGSGQLRWTPDIYTETGNYAVIFNASDNCSPTSLTDSKTVLITVTPGMVEWEPAAGTVAGTVTGLFGFNLSVFALTTNGLHRSDNNGRTWARSDTGIQDTCIRQLAANPSRTSLFAITCDGQLYRSTSNGAQWNLFALLINNPGFGPIAVTDSHVFVTPIGGGLFRAPLSGGSFTQVLSPGLSPLRTADRSIAAFGMSDNALFIGCGNTINSSGSGRAVRLPCSTFGNPGGTLSLPVELVAQGNESGLAFSLNFNPVVLTNPQVALGNGAGSALLITNTTQVAQGRLGLGLNLPPGQSFAAGVRQVAVVTFTIGNAAASNTALTFGDQPLTREMINTGGGPLITDYQSCTEAGGLLGSRFTYRSDLQGLSWTSSADILGTGTVSLAAIGNTVFGIDDLARVFRSDNNGQNWTQHSQSSFGRALSSIGTKFYGFLEGNSGARSGPPVLLNAGGGFQEISTGLTNAAIDKPIVARGTKLFALDSTRQIYLRPLKD